MQSQESYNQWFKEMIAKYMSNYYGVLSCEQHNNLEYLLFTILHPDDDAKKIEVSTYGRELTLYVLGTHSHHDQYEDGDHEEEFRDLVELIENIRSDKVYFSCVYLDGALQSSMWSFDLGEHIKQKGKVVVKSWSGLNDQTANNG